MLHKLRQRANDERGFTLIELLVVILIIGILAAIAIPSFLNQRSKASDASAKELARTAQTTAETIATDNGGSYATVSPATLNSTEPTIGTTVSTTDSYLLSASGTANSFVVTTKSTSGDQFVITRSSTGVTSRTCSIPLVGANPGGCQNVSGTSGTW